MRVYASKEVEYLNGKKDDEIIEGYRRAINTHMIVAALITTVALTAGFAMPGGFDGNEGPTQGSPILIKKTAFKIFIATDTIALLFSLSSLFLYFIATWYEDASRVEVFIVVSALLSIFSITSMMVAFITGTYAVLAPPSPATAISVECGVTMEKLKAMEETLVKGRQMQDDCFVVLKKLRAIIHSIKEQLRVHKKQTLFLTHLTTKTLPKGLHCLPLRLTTDYFTLNTSERHFPN
ncbi:hypothetical protein AgCh_019346 [Apium graveolens]